MTKHKEMDEADENVGFIFPTERPSIDGLVVDDVVPPLENGLEIISPLERRRNRKEEYAGILAVGLFILFSTVVLIYILAAIFLPSIENIKDVFQVIFPVISGMLSAAGVYYHSEKNK